jgi:hypothetical protein
VKTATEVLEAIDNRIERMRGEAVGPCVDALLEWADREAYREAMKRAHALKAIERLRSDLATEIEATPNGESRAKRRRRGTS